VESNDEGLRAYDPQTGTWADLTMVNGDFVSVLHALLQYDSIAMVQNPLQQWVNDPPLTSVDRCYYGVHAQLLLALTSAMGTLTSQTVATVGHMAHARLLLAPTTAMGTLTSVDRYYCWTCGTHAIAASAHYNDRYSDISRPLLLLDTWHPHGCCLCPQQRWTL
jgi:hypothetical protein